MVVAASCMGGVAAQLSRRLGHNTLSKITDGDSSKFSQRYDASESALPQGLHKIGCSAVVIDNDAKVFDCCEACWAKCLVLFFRRVSH